MGLLGRERAPEAAAVGGEVDPVAGGVEHAVRVSRIDRDVEARRQPATRLAPRRAPVARDQKRRPAVDERDNGRAARRRGHEPRQPELGALTGDRDLALAADCHVLDVELEHAGDRPHPGDHEDSSSTRVAVVAAWRAADAGRWPAARAQT